MNFISRFYDKLKIYGRSKEFFYFLVAIGVTALVILIAAFFLPTPLRLLVLLVFIVLAVTTGNAYLGLARLKFELKLKRHEFQTVIENIKDGAIVYDPNFKILSLNRAAEEILELKKEELLGEYVDPALIKKPHFKILAQVIFPSLAPSVSQISESGSWPQIVELSLDEPPLELNTSLQRIVDEKQNTVGFLKLIKDKTREKAILKEKSEFISVAAHQLRTPLTAINWSLENLLKFEENIPSQVKESVKETFEISERALKITNDLLDVSRIEEGHFGYTFEDVDLVSLIKSILNTAIPIAKEYSVNIYFEPKGIETLKTRLDPTRISTTMLNLLDNAIRYNLKNGRVTVYMEKLKDKPFVKISVEDSGVGVAPEDANKVFKKFYRGANIIQMQPNGSGLGLYIARNIVKRHGGEIGFESTLNRGSVFWFTLPLDPSFVPPKEIALSDY